ncbi:MAG: GNAT family N-acetyltransferase [Saprospiraceae bacterium]
MMYVIPIDFATPAFEETLALRRKILRIPLGLTFELKDIAQEYQDYHLACYSAEAELLACLVLTVKDYKRIKMRQVAVDDTIQSKGVGTFLVKACEDFCRNLGFERIVLNARDTAVEFYEKLDYDKVGEPFEEVTIKHFKMEKVLKGKG